MTDYNQDEVLMKMFKKLFGFIVFVKTHQGLVSFLNIMNIKIFLGIGRQYFSNKANKVNKKSH